VDRFQPSRRRWFYEKAPALLKQPEARPTLLGRIGEKMVRESKYKINEGDTFGMWIVIKPNDPTADREARQNATCKCQRCGNVVATSIYNLVLGKTNKCRSCHTYADIVERAPGEKARLKRIWKCIKNRCMNRRVLGYQDYGGRGISLCNEWLDFRSFYEWSIANGYTNELQIDRRDTNGNYEPENCRWVTSKTNNRNRRNNHQLTAFGETKPIAAWADDDRCDVSSQTLAMRIRSGMAVEEAILRPRRVLAKC
jgi:hypothetical protein